MFLVAGSAALVAQPSNLISQLTGSQAAPSAESADAAEDEAAAVTAEAVEASQAELQEQLEEARSRLDAAGAGTSTDVVARIELLERLDRVFNDQLQALRQHEDLQVRAAEVERESQSGQTDLGIGFGAVSFEALEQLYDESDALQQAQRWSERSRESALDRKQTAADTFEATERARRSAREKADKNPGQFLIELETAQLRSRVAREELSLASLEWENLELEQTLIEPQLEQLRPRLEWIKKHFVPSPEARAARAEQREKRAEDLRDEIEEARRVAARAATDLARRESRTEAEARSLDPWRESRRLASSRMGLLSRQLTRLDEFAAIERQRFAVLQQTTTKAQAKLWADENENRLETQDGERRQHLGELIRIRRLHEVAPDREASAAERALRELASQWIETAETELADLDALRAARRRLQTELADMGVASMPSLSEAWPAFWDGVKTVWGYELFSVEDRPVRVSTLFVVALLVLLGVVAARRVSHFASDVAVKRFRWSQGRASAWRTLLYYGFLCFIVLTIFSLFHFSLTQFSVVSGALAVGIGFGSQNLLNNFISGIILLVERPISEGSLIEIDGEQLWVERIGIRSTVVRSFDNTHIVVPNSRLLEQPVANWTLSDDVVRQKIAVGVAYGSDTRLVERLLREVMGKLDIVLETPEPIVLFDDFGDNALNFVAILHTRLNDRFEALTEIRHAIVEAFAEAGVVIAFPQRDVHLDTAKPLQLEISRARPAAVVEGEA